MPLITSIFHTLLSNNEHELATQTSPNPSSSKASTILTCLDCHKLLKTDLIYTVVPWCMPTLEEVQFWMWKMCLNMTCMLALVRIKMKWHYILPLFTSLKTVTTAIEQCCQVGELSKVEVKFWFILSYWFCIYCIKQHIRHFFFMSMVMQMLMRPLVDLFSIFPSPIYVKIYTTLLQPRVLYHIFQP